jgi:hypothetical protein
MLDTYIKNRGITKMLVHNNNHNHVNEINWDADYDGNTANVSIDFNNNGRTNHYDIELDNNDLANILNVNSVNRPLHKRLQTDFKRKNRPPVYVEIMNESMPSILPTADSFYNQSPNEELPQKSLINNNNISTLLPNEEIIVPLTLNKNSLNSLVLTKRRRHYRPRTHKTYKAYKRLKSLPIKLSKKSNKRRTRRTF